MHATALDAMRIDIQSGELDRTSYVRELVRTQLAAAARDLGDHVQTITVHLHTDTSPSNGVISVCSILVRLQPTGEFRARGEDFRWDVAVTRACDAMRASIARERLVVPSGDSVVT
jgi:hypothetical protein